MSYELESSTSQVLLVAVETSTGTSDLFLKNYIEAAIKNYDRENRELSSYLGGRSRSPYTLDGVKIMSVVVERAQYTPKDPESAREDVKRYANKILLDTIDKRFKGE